MTRPPVVAFKTGDKYRIFSDLRWELGRKGSGVWYTVPAGSFFDVSIPRGLRWLLNPDDPRFFRASALHDTMLADGWDRLTAGAAFADGLKADYVPKLTRMLMWLAVSLYRFE